MVSMISATHVFIIMSAPWFIEWQDDCLRLPCLADNNNLIYSLPTSGGKHW